MRVGKQYTFDTGDGPQTLAGLFAGRSQLLIYHIMFGPDWTAACPACAALVDHFDPMLAHLAARDVTLVCASHAPLGKLHAYKRRMGWRFPYISWSGSDYGFDFGASFSQEQQREVPAAVLGQFQGDEAIAEMAASCGTDLAGYVTTEGPGLSAFDDGAVYQTLLHAAPRRAPARVPAVPGPGAEKRQGRRPHPPPRRVPAAGKPLTSRPRASRYMPSPGTPRQPASARAMSQASCRHKRPGGRARSTTRMHIAQFGCHAGGHKGEQVAEHIGYARAGSLVSTHSPCSGCSSSPAGASPHTPAAGSSYIAKSLTHGR